MKHSSDNSTPGRAILTPRGVERTLTRHLWIYRSDVAKVESAASGDIVRVEDRRGRFIGWAHFGAESEISLRFLSFDENPIDVSFWRHRLQAAVAYRRQIASEVESHRLVHAEGDLLPGRIIDDVGNVALAVGGGGEGLVGVIYGRAGSGPGVVAQLPSVRGRMLLCGSTGSRGHRNILLAAEHGLEPRRMFPVRQLPKLPELPNEDHGASEG